MGKPNQWKTLPLSVLEETLSWHHKPSVKRVCRTST